MTKLFKIMVILCLFYTFCCNLSFATDVDMNTIGSQIYSNTINNNTNNIRNY